MHKKVFSFSFIFLITAGTTISPGAGITAIGITRALAANDETYIINQSSSLLETELVQKVLAESQQSATTFKINNDIRRAAHTAAERVEKVATDTHTQRLSLTTATRDLPFAYVMIRLHLKIHNTLSKISHS